LKVLLLVYAAITLHMVLIWAVGGLHSVPFVVFGACQYIPGALTLLLVPQWRHRLWGLFFRRIGTNWMIGGYLLTVVTLGASVLLPYLTGHHAGAFDADLWRRYPLQLFVPAELYPPAGFVLFVLLVAPALHLLNAIGEEVFWRGYLLDWLDGLLSRRLAWLADGVLWGLWHAPMILLLGWDFPGWPVLGILSITVSQVFWSVVLCHATRRTRSLWPAVVIHATANALTVGLYDLLVDHNLNLVYSPWGFVGGMVMAIAALPLLNPRAPLHTESDNACATFRC